MVTSDTMQREIMIKWLRRIAIAVIYMAIADTVILGLEVVYVFH